MSDTIPLSKKQYIAPKLTKVPSEEAKALLLDQAMQDDHEAENLLPLLSEPA